MVNLFRSLLNPLQLAGIVTINDLYTELDETIANKLVIIGDNVQLIRLPHTKFMYESIVTFAFLSAFTQEDGRLVSMLPHWGENIDGDVTATFQLILGENGATLAAEKAINRWHVLEGNIKTASEEFSSSSVLETSSSTSSSESSELSKSSSSSTLASVTSSQSSSSSSSFSSILSFTSSSSTAVSETSSSSSTAVSETSSFSSSSSTINQSTSSTSVEFSSFSSSSSQSSSSSSTFVSFSSGSTTSQSSC